MSIMQMLLGTSSGGPSVDVASLFDVTLYSGTGNSDVVTNGLNISGEGGLVWIKNRSQGSNSNSLADTERGGNKRLESDTGDQQATGNTAASFRTNGFVVTNNTDTNALGQNYVAWCFVKGANFFDIVKYEGNGNSSQTISHNLGASPGMIFVKCFDQDNKNWRVFHKDMGVDSYLELNDFDSENESESDIFPSLPTSTTFTVGNDSTVGANNFNYVAYLFANTAGAIKTGSYDGASSDVTVNCGFEPQFVMLKPYSGATGIWSVFDSARGATKQLRWEVADAESTNSVMTFTSSGFTVSSTNANYNGSGRKFIFMAIADA